MEKDNSRGMKETL